MAYEMIKNLNKKTSSSSSSKKSSKSTSDEDDLFRRVAAYARAKDQRSIGNNADAPTVESRVEMPQTESNIRTYHPVTPTKAQGNYNYGKVYASRFQPDETEEEEDNGYRDATLKDLTINSLKQGYYNALYGSESFKAMMGSENEKQKYEDILSGEDYQFNTGNLLEKGISGGANLLGQMARQITDNRTLNTALTGAGTFAAGAGIAGQAGPQVLLPEEIVTVPSAAVAGFVTGMKLGSSASNFEIEAGLAYNEMIDNGISEDTAKKIAMCVGGVNAALEFVQGDEIIKSLKILNKNPATKEAANTLGKRLVDMGIDVTKSVGRETIQEVAQEGSTIAGTQIGSKIDTGDWAYNSDEVLNRLGETAASSALSFGLLNVPGAALRGSSIISENNTKNKIGSKYNADINALVEEGLQSDQNSDSYRIASRLKEKLDSGETVSNSEAYDLAVANQKAINLEERNKAPAAVSPSVTSATASAETASPTQSRFQSIQERLIESGMDAEAASITAQSLDRILGGDTSVTGRDKDVLRAGNTAARTIFEEESGVKLPASNASTRKTVADYIAQTALKQNTTTEESSATASKKEAVVSQPPANVMSTDAINQLKGSVQMTTDTATSPEAALRKAAQTAVARKKIGDAVAVQTTMSTVGAKGNAVYQQYLGGAKDIGSYTRAFEHYYDAGQIGYPLERIDSAYSEGVDPKMLVEAYSAGQMDAFASSEGKRATQNQKATKRVKKRNKGKGRFYDNRTAGAKSVPDKDTAALKQMAKVFNVDIEVVDTIADDSGRSIANGYYDAAAGKIVIAADSDNPLMTVAKHEITHHLQRLSPQKYQEYKDYVMRAFYGNSQEAMNAEIQRRIDLARIANQKLTRDGAMDEIVADATEKFLTDRESIDALVRENRSLAETILNAIRDVLRKMEAAMRGEKIGTNSDFLNVEQLKQAEKMWVDALTSAAMEDNVGIMFDGETESFSPVFSMKTWNESEYANNRIETAKIMAKQLGITEKAALDYIEDINSVARLIADDRVRLDYDSNVDENATVLKSNQEYKYTVDMSTLCAKRLLFTGTFDAIQRAMPNTVFNSEDIVRLRKMMMDKHLEVACGICYVESTRREIGRITQDFIDQYKLAQKTGNPISRVNSTGKTVELKKTKEQMANTADQSTDKFFAEKGYTPTLADLNTTYIDIVKRDHPLVYEAYLNFMNARGQAKPKLLETRAEYKGEILKHFKAKTAVKSRNDHGGLRLQSFSDFEVPHMIDMMQVIMDMSRVGLKSQAYTKVPAFADVFGDTGVKINLSLIAKGDGLDANGNLIFDDVEGINHNEAFRLRDQYSKNVGTILVGKNDAHIIAAMADPRIDFIIPFHKSSWKESLYDALGLTGYADYTETQNEKPIDKNRKIENFDPSEYWDFSKTGDENAQIYLEKCREDGRIPKFPQFQSYPGYWKLLIDFKMYDNDGVGSPQNVVRPDFNMDAAKKILNDYKGGHRSFPVAQDVVDEFVSKYKEAHKVYQSSFTDADSEKFYDSEKQFSLKVTDKKTLDSLENQDYIITYKTMQLVDGKLYPPMASRINGKFEDYSELGSWEMATEHPELIRNGNKFKLDKGKGQGSIDAAYNPYMHSSNLVLNDQFSGAYKRDNLVTVECHVPVSEITSGYHAEFAKDSVGWHPWHTGTVAGQLRQETGIERQVFLSRWIKPVRIVPDSEVASMYKKLLDGTNVEVPDNVVTPSLLSELKNAGVKIKESGRLQYSLKDSAGNTLTAEQAEYFKDSKVRDADGNLLVMYHGTKADFTVFDRSYIGSTGRYEGSGFNFTPSKSRASGYSNEGKVLSGYVNIRNPLSSEKKTITVSKLAKIIREIDPTGDNIISDYAQDTRDYGKPSFISRESITTARSIYDYAENDVDIYSNLSVGNPDSESLIDKFKSYGYDGLIHYYDDGSIKTCITFDSNQFKNIGNTNPTSDSDIRFSLKDAKKMETDLNNLRDERSDLESQIDLAYMNDLSDAEVRNLENRLVKVNADIDRIVSEERRASVKTSMQDILENLSKYRRSDLESLAEQISDGNWDGYEELSRSELEDALREEIQNREYSTLEMQSKKYGMYVRPVDPDPGIQYQLKTPDDIIIITNQIMDEERKAKAVTDAEIMSQEVKGIAKTDAEKKAVSDYQRAMKKLADYEKKLAVYEATKAEHSKGRSIYADASGKVKKSAVKYSAAEKAELQRKADWWKRRLREIEQKEAFQKVLKREKSKMAQKHEQKLSDLRDIYNKRMDALRDQRNAKVEAEKQKMRDYKQHQRDSKEYKALKSKLENDVKWLSERLVHPTDSKHIPDDFKRVVASFLEQIDFTTERMDKNTAKNGAPSNKVIDMWTLVDAYQNIALDDGSQIVLTPIEDAMLDSLKKTFGQGKRVENLSYEELQMVHDVIRYIKLGVATVNKTFNENIKENVSDLGEALIAEQRSKKKRTNRIGAIGQVDKLINFDNVSPADKFHEYGGVMEKLYGEIRKGFDRHIDNVKTAIAYTKKLTEGHEKDIKEWSGKKAKAKQFKISDGTTIELTTAQVMSLYELMKRDQAVGHVLGSGIVPSNVVVTESKKFGKVKIDRAKQISAEKASRCTIEDIQKIVDTLTDEQKKIADGISKLFTTKCADWGNETSMKLYGYKKFTEKNYFPIKSSDAYLNARFDDSGDALIKNLGFTKNTVVNANNPIVVEDIFDVLADHVNKMSMYNALVVPLTDFSRVFNYKSRNADGTISDSVQMALEASGGKLGISYVMQFMKDVNKQATSLQSESFINMSIANYKKAKIAASLRVLVQQPTSITRAADMIDPKYIVNGLAQKANYEEMFENSPIAYWKSLGFYQTDMARNMKDILLDNESLMDRYTMGVYGKADDFSWAHLWNAVKLEQADLHPDMDKTSSEFMDLVSKRFEEVVDRTQVVDSVFHRSQIMRAPGAAAKMATAFMSEPTKAFNLLRTDLIDSVNSKDYSKIGRSVAVYVANAILVSAAAGLVDVVRDDDDEDEEGNKRTIVDKYVDNTLENIRDNINPLNMVPYLKELSSVWSGYSVNRMDMASISNMATTLQKWTSGKYSWPYLAKETAGAVGEVFGIPFKNVMRDLISVARTTGDLVGGHYYAEYMVSKLKYNIANSQNRSVFYKHYTDALLAGDDTAAELILQDMVTNGVPYENIISRGYQAEKKVVFKDAKKLIDDGETSEAKKLVRDLAKKYDKKFSTLWNALTANMSSESEGETYDFNDLKNAVRKGQDTEDIEDYLIDSGAYSKESMEEAIKMLTDKYR